MHSTTSPTSFRLRVLGATDLVLFMMAAAAVISPSCELAARTVKWHGQAICQPMA